VDAGQILQANGRAVMAEGWSPAAEKSLWKSLVNWWRTPMVMIPVGTSFLLGAVAVYQGNVLIPQLRQARILPGAELTGASRGEGKQIVIQKGALFYSLDANIPPDAQYPLYICELTPEGVTGGAVVFKLTAPAPEAGEPIKILASAGDVHSGQFQLTVFGAGSDGVQREKVATLPVAFHFAQ
jgi:hypothetical protein